MSDDFFELSLEPKSIGSGWRVKPKLQGDPKYAEYVRRMAEEQRKLFKPKPRPVRPEGMSEEDFQFSLQAKSTQEMIIYQKDPDYKRDWTAPLPENYLAVPDAKTKEELVGERNISLHEFSTFESARRSSKNTLGQSEFSAFDKEAKNRAAHAFVVSPPAFLNDDEINQVTSLTKPVKGIQSSLPPIKKKEKGRFWSWAEKLAFIGKPIK